VTQAWEEGISVAVLAEAAGGPSLSSGRPPGTAKGKGINAGSSICAPEWAHLIDLKTRTSAQPLRRRQVSCCGGNRRPTPQPQTLRAVPPPPEPALVLQPAQSPPQQELLQEEEPGMPKRLGQRPPQLRLTPELKAANFSPMTQPARLALDVKVILPPPCISH
jgi:hypothetical protein